MGKIISRSHSVLRSYWQWVDTGEAHSPEMMPSRQNGVYALKLELCHKNVHTHRFIEELFKITQL